MKKMIHKENTREKDIIDQKETKEDISKNPKGIGQHLENIKIFCEIFSYVFVGVMGIIISVVGLNFNKRTTEIYQRQLEILDNDREPCFTIQCEVIRRFEGADNNSYKKNLYTIKNEGGLINGASLHGIGGCATVLLFNPNTNTGIIYELYIREMFEYLDGLSSPYNEENRNFYFYGYEGSKYDNFKEELKLKLSELFTEYSIVIVYKNYIDIVYVNYKNEECRHRYEFTKDKLSLYTYETGIEEIYSEAIEKAENAEIVAKNIYNTIKENGGK